MLIFWSLEHGSEQIEMRKWLYFLTLCRTTVSTQPIVLYSSDKKYLNSI